MAEESGALKVRCRAGRCGAPQVQSPYTSSEEVNLIETALQACGY